MGEPLYPNDVWKPERPRHDGGVGGLPSPFGAEAEGLRAPELGRVRGRQLMGDGDAAFGRVLGRSRVAQTDEVPEQPFADQGHVALPVPKVGISMRSNTA